MPAAGLVIFAISRKGSADSSSSDTRPAPSGGLPHDEQDDCLQVQPGHHAHGDSSQRLRVSSVIAASEMATCSVVVASAQRWCWCMDSAERLSNSVDCASSFS